MSKSSIVVFDKVEAGELHSASNVIRAISHPMRLKILSIIDKNKSLTVNQLFTILNVDQSIASQQLHILRSANLVKTKREGKFVYYKLNYESLGRVNALIENFRIK